MGQFHAKIRGILCNLCVGPKPGWRALETVRSKMAQQTKIAQFFGAKRAKTVVVEVHRKQDSHDGSSDSEGENGDPRYQRHINDFDKDSHDGVGLEKGAAQIQPEPLIGAHSGTHASPINKDAPSAAMWNTPPEMFVSMMRQQQDLLQAMSSFVPNKRGIKDTQAAAGAPSKKTCKRKLQVETETGLSEGELEENEQVDELSEKLDAWGDEDEDQDGGEPDVYDEIKLFFEKEDKLGVPVSKDTAEIVEMGMRGSVLHSKEKELMERVLRPANCDQLIVPRVNSEIWKEIRKDTRDNDVTFQRIQSLVHKGLTPIISVMDSMTDKKDKGLRRKLGEGFRLLALASSHLSQKRKEQIAPDLDQPFRQVCGASQPVTQYLFGDDLPKALKDIKEAQHVAAKSANSGFRGYGRPRGKNFSQRGDYKARGGYGNNRFLGSRNTQGYQGYQGHQGYQGQQQQQYQKHQGYQGYQNNSGNKHRGGNPKQQHNRDRRDNQYHKR